MSQGSPEPPGTWQAKVFLAYASEDSDLAAAVQEAIENCANRKQGGTVEVRKWPVKAKLTKSILESVQSGLRARDFGVFLYSPVDGVDGKARDNVVFESGLFIGMKKADRAIILLPENHHVAPSDLHGILGLNYPYAEVLAAEDHLARVAILGGIGADIVDRIRAIMAQPPPYGKARDNVVFETGLCLGMKDAAHTVLLLPKGADVTPSDLRGIIGIEYPYQELENVDYTERLDKLDRVGARIVEKIYKVMAETSLNQEQPDAGQPRSGKSAGQPSAALEMFNAGWTLEAALGRLGPLEGEIYTGRFVVHAAMELAT